MCMNLTFLLTLLDRKEFYLYKSLVLRSSFFRTLVVGDFVPSLDRLFTLKSRNKIKFLF